MLKAEKVFQRVAHVISLLFYSECFLFTTAANTLGLGEPLFWSMPVLLFLLGMCIYYHSNGYVTEVFLWRHWIGAILPFFLSGEVDITWANTQLYFALQSCSKIFNLFAFIKKKKKKLSFICLYPLYTCLCCIIKNRNLFPRT